MLTSKTPSHAAIEATFILGFTIIEEYAQMLCQPISIINAAKDIYQLTKSLDYLRSKSAKALAAACIFCACREEGRRLDLQWVRISWCLVATMVTFAALQGMFEKAIVAQRSPESGNMNTDAGFVDRCTTRCREICVRYWRCFGS